MNENVLFSVGEEVSVTPDDIVVQGQHYDPTSVGQVFVQRASAPFTSRFLLRVLGVVALVAAALFVLLFAFGILGNGADELKIDGAGFTLLWVAAGIVPALALGMLLAWFGYKSSHALYQVIINPPASSDRGSTRPLAVWTTTDESLADRVAQAITQARQMHLQPQ